MPPRPDGPGKSELHASSFCLAKHLRSVFGNNCDEQVKQARASGSRAVYEVSLSIVLQATGCLLLAPMLHRMVAS